MVESSKRRNAVNQPQNNQKSQADDIIRRRHKLGLQKPQ
jgi:hypothetical protein